MGDVFDPACDPANPLTTKIGEITEAYDRIKSGIVETPCIKSHLSDTTNMELYIKKEFLQYTGSFKERGARNCMMTLSGSKGVMAASAGNHAQAISYHGLQLGIKVSVVMPVMAPIMKIEKCKKFKANVIVQGNDMKEAKEIAMKMAKEQGLTYVNGYDHPKILSGQGTIGLEILSQVPDIDAVIVPIGGGGLIAGISAAVKALSPKTQIIGVQSENCSGFAAALEAGKPVVSPCKPTLADGLAVPMVGVNAFETARQHIDKIVVVKEEIIAMSILAILELEKCIVEGAGATPLAAIFSGSLPELKGKKVVLILSGGNIDSTILGRVLERGLASLGRLIKFEVTIRDKVDGGISDLLQKLRAMGASVKDVTHERAWVISDIFSVNVKIICETRGITHAIEVKEALEKDYDTVDFSYFPNPCVARAFGL